MMNKFELFILVQILQFNFFQPVFCADLKAQVEQKEQADNEARENNEGGGICLCCFKCYDRDQLPNECRIMWRDDAESMEELIDKINKEDDEIGKQIRFNFLAIRAARIVSLHCLRCLINEIDLETKKHIYQILIGRESTIHDVLVSINMRDELRIAVRENYRTYWQSRDKKVKRAQIDIRANLKLSGVTDQELYELIRLYI